MKLLYCRACQDVVRLIRKTRSCKCKLTKGKYVDDINAIYQGEHAVPIGFANGSFFEALLDQPEGPGPGRRFEAFVIPKKCPTMVKKK